MSDKADPNLLRCISLGCKYYAYFMQGGGCDYTIGCGFKLVPLVLAHDLTTAREQALSWVDEHIDPECLSEIVIIEGKASVLGYELIYEEREAEQKRQEELREQEENERRERKEYERLKKKYEN